MASLFLRSTSRRARPLVPGPAQAGFRPATAALAVAAAFGLNALPASAQPVPKAVIHGSATFVGNGSNLTVTTTNGAGTNHSAINWSSFSVPAGSVTQFVQPGATSTSINRVVDANPSQILGRLASNGRLVLVNPFGITVGQGAQVDTAGFTASTLGMSDADALAGRLRFGGSGALLQVDGAIKAQGGDVVLIAPQLRTGASAVIEADGAAVLAAGQKVEITGRGLEGILMEVRSGDSALNLGSLKGDAVGMFAGTLRHSGLVQAQAVSTEGGKVVLKAAGDAIVDGSISARAGDHGGRIDVFGERVGLFAGAALDASGAAGGGQVRVGGDYQGANREVPNARAAYVDATATIRADATQQGDGGRVIVWSDENTRMAGRITARGGAQGGNGGFAEVSGKDRLQFSGRVDLRAPQGTAGQLLLDPNDIVISGSQSTTTATTGSEFSGGLDQSYVSAADLGAQLELGNVLLTTSASSSTTSAGGGLITLASDATVSWGAGTTLTLHADNGIALAGTVNAGNSGSTLHLLTEQGSIQQTGGSLRAGRLLAQAGGGDVLLDQPNHVGVLAGEANAVTGNFVFRNVEDLTIAPVSAVYAGASRIGSGAALTVRSDSGSLHVRSDVSGGTLTLDAAADVDMQGYLTVATNAGQARITAGRDVLLAAGRSEDPAIAVEQGSITVSGWGGLAISAGRNVHASGHGLDGGGAPYDNPVTLSGNGGSTGGVAVGAAGDVDFGAQTHITTQMAPVSVTATSGSILGRVRASTGGTVDGSIRLEALNGSVSFNTLDARGSGGETATAKGGDVTVGARGNIDGSSIDASGAYHSVEQPDASGGNVSVVSSAGSITLNDLTVDGGWGASATSTGRAGSILLSAAADLADGDPALLDAGVGYVRVASGLNARGGGAYYSANQAPRAGADGGAITVKAKRDIVFGGPESAAYIDASGGQGGASDALGTGAGGRGGTVTLLAGGGVVARSWAAEIRADGGDGSNDPATAPNAGRGGQVDIQAGLGVQLGAVQALGGGHAGSDALSAGDGGSVSITAGQDIAVTGGSILVTGGYGYLGKAGRGGSVTLTSTGGGIAIGGDIHADGQYGGTGGGDAGVVALRANGNVDARTISAISGASDGAGASAPAAGSVSVVSDAGNIHVGSVEAYGGHASASTGGDGGTIQLTALGTAAGAGNITVDDALASSGGHSHATSSTVQGGRAGAITLLADKDIQLGGTIAGEATTPSVVAINLDGGSAQYSTEVTGTGGAAGEFRAVSTQGSIAVHGSIHATGGAGSTDGAGGGGIVLQAQGTGSGVGLVTVDGGLEFSGGHGDAGNGGQGGTAFIRADKGVQLLSLAGLGGDAHGSTGTAGQGGSVDVASAAGGITLGRSGDAPSPGSINVSGGSGAAAGSVGGRGGSIQLAASGGAVDDNSGLLFADGGSGYAGGGAAGSLGVSASGAVALGYTSLMGGQDWGTLGREGAGGSVAVSADGDVSLGDVYAIGRSGGSVTAVSRGGNLGAGNIAAYASSNEVAAVGGSGGTVTLQALSTAAGAGNINVTGTIDAEGAWASDSPGAGGGVTISAARNIVASDVRVTSGWTSTGTGTSGVGGTIAIDSATGDVSTGSLDASGQQGGTISVRAHEGNIAILDASAHASYSAAALPGGTITLEALGTAADRGNITVTGSVGADGSSAFGGGGSAGGLVSVHADKNISIGAGASAQGGVTDAEGFAAGDGGSVSIVSGHGSIAANWITAGGGYAYGGAGGKGGSVLLQATAAGASVTAGDVDVSGGSSSLGAGGSGGTLNVQADQLASLSRATVRGGSSSTGAGGAGGTVALSSTAAGVEVASGIDAQGGSGSDGGRGGFIQVSAGAAVTLGGAWADGGGAMVSGGIGGTGGRVEIRAVGDIGSASSVISAEGGSGNDAAGGDGGTINLVSSGGSILTGWVDAAGGYGAPGGQGGAVGLQALGDIASTVWTTGGAGASYEGGGGAGGGNGGTATLRFGGGFSGSVDAQGGHGEDGGSGNASGGAGGQGGVIDFARTTGGTLQLQDVQLLANGGAGGFAAAGSAATGGSGGNGGILLVDAQLGALTLAQDPTTSATPVLNASAGRGGLDGAHSVAAATGAAGSVSLHAASDLRIDALALGDAITSFSAAGGGNLEVNAALHTQGGAVTLAGNSLAATASIDSTVDGMPTSTGGEVRLTADQLDLQGTVQSGTARTVVSALGASRAIRLGGVDDGSALHLSQGEIDRISAGTLRFGGADHSAGITVGGPITVDAARVANLALVTTGTIAQDAGSNLVAHALDAEGSSVALDNVSVGTLSGRGQAGAFSVANHGGGSLAIGHVDGTAGIAAVGPVTVTTDGALSLVDSITGQATGDAVVLSATNLDVGAGAGISTPSGRWLVYLASLDGNYFGTLASGNYALWGRSYTANPPATVSETGNRYLFATQPGLDIVADAASKVYDGTSNFNLTFQASGLVDASLYQNAFLQDAAPSYTGSLALLNGTKNVGSYAITQGTLSSSYRINSFTGNTATITPAALTVSGLSASKVYDGTTAASFGTSATLAGLVAGDDVVYGGGTGSFDTRNVGTGKLVTVGSISLTGADLGNYTVTLPTSITGSITPATLSVSGLSATKVYDGTTAASFGAGATLLGLVAGDDVAYGGGTGTFDTKNAGTGKQVTVNGITLAGADIGNYTVATPPTITGSITPAPLTVSGLAALGKVYDATTDAALQGSASVAAIGGDAVSLAGTASGRFADKNVGTAKPVSVGGLSLAGADAGNYVLNLPTLSADITPASVTIAGLVANDKVYDGTTAATLSGNAALQGVFAGDSVALGTGSASFADKNAGTAKPVTAGVSLSGADAGNYRLVGPALTATITPAPLTVTARDRVKAEGTTLELGSSEFEASGLVAGESLASVTLASAGTPAAAAAGTYPIVASSALGTGGFVAANYSITYRNGLLTVDAAASPVIAAAVTQVNAPVINTPTPPVTPAQQMKEEAKNDARPDDKKDKSKDDIVVTGSSCKPS